MIQKKLPRKPLKMVINLGVVNTMLVTMHTAPVVAQDNVDAKPGGSILKMQPLPKTKEERVTVRQRSTVLTATVTGTPGRHLAAFWSKDTNYERFRAVPVTTTRFNSTGAAILKVDLSRLPAKRFYLTLRTADDPKFSQGVMDTGAIEIELNDKNVPTVAGSTEGPIIGSFADKGAGFTAQDILSIDQTTNTSAPAKATADSLFRERLKVPNATSVIEDKSQH